MTDIEHDPAAADTASGRSRRQERGGPGFFDAYPRFTETSTVAADLARLNFRYRHLIGNNAGLLRGRRVLDIASHDGRFTFAALRGAEAAHVTGIEARDTLVERARETLGQYEVPAGRYDFRVGDIFEVLPQLPVGSIDTVMILGFLYHTARQYELFAAVSRLGARALIVDSTVLPNEDAPVIRLKLETTEAESRIWDGARSSVLSSVPSAAALRMLMEEFGYRVTTLGRDPEHPFLPKQYRSGRRVAMIGGRD